MAALDRFATSGFPRPRQRFSEALEPLDVIVDTRAGLSGLSCVRVRTDGEVDRDCDERRYRRIAKHPVEAPGREHEHFRAELREALPTVGPRPDLFAEREQRSEGTCLDQLVV